MDKLFWRTMPMALVTEVGADVQPLTFSTIGRLTVNATLTKRQDRVMATYFSVCDPVTDWHLLAPVRRTTLITTARRTVTNLSAKALANGTSG